MAKLATAAWRQAVSDPRARGVGYTWETCTYFTIKSNELLPAMSRAPARVAEVVP
jgi:hypothetical protein